MAKRQLGLAKRAKAAKKQKTAEAAEEKASGRAETVKKIAKKAIKTAAVGELIKKGVAAGLAEPTEGEAVEGDEEDADNTLATVPLWDDVDPDSPAEGLAGLWNTFLQGKKDNELILNGIVNEADGILRSTFGKKEEGETDEAAASEESASTEDSASVLPKISPELYAVFGLALAELAKFQRSKREKAAAEAAEAETEQGVSIKEFFDAAVERVDAGLEKFPESNLLKLAKAVISLNELPLQFISKMDKNSTKKQFPDIKGILEKALKLYEGASTAIAAYKGTKAAKADEEMTTLEKKQHKLDLLKDLTAYDGLESLDDLFEIIRHFGKAEEDSVEDGEGDEDKDEVYNEDDEDRCVIGKDHPLFSLLQKPKAGEEQDQEVASKYSDFFKEQAAALAKHLAGDIKTEQDKKHKAKKQEIRRNALRRLGLLYLMQAEKPAAKYADLKFGGADDEEEADDEPELSEEDAAAAEDARQEALSLAELACNYLKDAYYDEEPRSWADLAEAQITYGNLFPMGSKEQEELYARAEKSLKKANNATHGKYQDILDSLRE